jgi:hypothetical protein
MLLDQSQTSVDEIVQLIVSSRGHIARSRVLLRKTANFGMTAVVGRKARHQDADEGKATSARALTEPA